MNREFTTLRSVIAFVSVVLAIGGMVAVGFFLLMSLSVQAWGSSK